MKQNCLSKRTSAKAVNITPQIEEKFWRLVKKGDQDDCWLFQTTNPSYPKLNLANKKYIFAHRVALAIKMGGSLAPGVFACHHCDNPKCVNPNHLFAGDAASNMQDKCKKGRQAKRDVINARRIPPRGEKVKTSKLKTAQIHEIRQANPKGVKAQDALGKQYGVSGRMIRYILKGTWWAAA